MPGVFPSPAGRSPWDPDRSAAGCAEVLSFSSSPILPRMAYSRPTAIAIQRETMVSPLPTYKRMSNSSCADPA